MRVATEITLSGTCETDATISISAEELITNPTTGTCADEVFSIPMHFSADAVDSTFSIDVTQTDLAGNESSVTTKEIQYINIGGGGKPSTENATPEIIQNQTSPDEKTSIKNNTSENIEAKEEIVKNPLNSAGESTCSKDDYLKNSIKFGRYNNPQDVKLLEEFLNTYEDTHLVVD